MKKQKNVIYIMRQMKNMTQEKKNQQKKKTEYGKNFQLQMTENQSMKKENMNLNKKLMLGKLIWQILKSLE